MFIQKWIYNIDVKKYTKSNMNFINGLIVIVIKMSCICRDFFAMGRSLRKDYYCFNPEIILLLLEPASWNLQQANTRFQTFT